MSDLSHLNPEQKEAVLFGEGPMLIVAGAGTGKTTVVVDRMKHLILDKHVPTTDILALTFTEKAAREMEERIDIALPYGYTQMWILTFHAFCDRVLRQEAIHIGLDPAYQLMTEAEAIMFLRKNLYKFDLTYFRPLGNPYKFISGILTHFSRLKDDDISPEQYQSFAKEISNFQFPISNESKKKKSKVKETSVEMEMQKSLELANAYALYEELKAKESVMDFSDLIANTLLLFRKRPNILHYYQEQFKYILVDEFQDTNFAQNELAIMLSGERKNINVVGDDDQAIYRWRGAALANITQFRQHFPESKIVTLNRNYRSSEEILTKSHQMIQHNNPDRLEISEKINKQLLSMRGVKGEPIEFIFGSRVENEAEMVAKKITELMKKKNYSYKDFAILVRANDHAQPFTRALDLETIPFQFLGPGHLFHQDEIKDLIAYLKVLVNFEDSQALYRVLTHPAFSFESRDIAAILNFAKKKNISLFESLEQIEDTFLKDETKDSAKKLIQMIKKHLTFVPSATAGQILYYFFTDAGILDSYINPQNNEDSKKAQNVAKFFEKLKSYEAEHEDASVFAIIDWIDLSMTLGESPLAADIDWATNDAVNILTIHSSKGLEFPVVFVVNLVTQRFPTRERRDQIPLPEIIVREATPEGDQNISEERRLFYVAMTRAKDMLFLTAANYYGEGKRERKISPFVYETLGEDYINTFIEKKNSEKKVQQLSLIDLLPIPNNSLAEKSPSALSPIPYPITYLSYSQIQTFEMCPLHYKLKYMLKIPSAPVPALSFGISVHGALRDYYQPMTTGQGQSVETLDALLKRNWIDEGYKSKSHEEQAMIQAKSIISKYVETNNETAHPIAIETPFTFSLGKLKIGGRIDRVDKKADGKIVIIDYKTGSHLPTEKELLTNLQLTTYALAATEIHDEIFHKNPEDILLELHYLDSETILQTTRTKEQLEEAKELLIQKAEEISQSDFVCSVMSCKDCEYNMICKTYAGA